jgi:hypothetical protein
MRYLRGMTACLLGLCLTALAGCTPVSDGWSKGVAGGLSAATSAFIEELANTLIGDLVPSDAT